MPTLAEFLAGHALAYRSFRGEPCSATFHTLPAPHLIIRDARGRQVAAPIMARNEAESFYGGIAAELATSQAAA